MSAQRAGAYFSIAPFFSRAVVILDAPITPIPMIAAL
jgi:hypothetical protein